MLAPLAGAKDTHFDIADPAFTNTAHFDGLVGATALTCSPARSRALR